MRIISIILKADDFANHSPYHYDSSPNECAKTNPINRVDLDEKWFIAEDFLVPLGGAAVVEGDATP